MNGERAVRRLSSRIRAWTAALSALLAAGSASAQVGVGPDRGSEPVLLLVLTAESGDATDRERRLFGELELALDSFTIETVPSGDPRFSLLPISEQISRVQPLVERTGAVATIWIEETGGGAILLHLVALTTGRALIRIVEARRGPDVEAELALTVRELLGEAYLFGPKPESPAMEQVVAEVQEKVAPLPPPAPPPSPPIAPRGDEPARPAPTLGLAPLGSVSGGIWGHAGPSIRAGGGLAVEWPPGAALFARASFVAVKGPDAQVRDGVVVGFGVAPGLSLGYRWRSGPIGVGPLLGIAVPYTSLTTVVGEGDDQTFTWWGFRATAGLELAVTVLDDLFLFVDGLFGFEAIRESFERASDRGTVLTTPFVEWEMLFGLMIFVG